MVVTQCMMCPFFAVIFVQFVDIFNFLMQILLDMQKKTVNDI